jgi:Flp pilus assembly protein TadD/SAM-dependent methyltransferase
MVNLSSALKLLKDGKTADAADIAIKYINTSPNDPDAHYILGKNEHERANFTLAKKHLNTAVEHRSNFLDAYLLLAEVCMELGQLSAAEEHSRRALESDDGSTDARVYLGRLTSRMGRLEEAAEYFSEAVHLSPTDRRARLGLAHVCDELGNYSAATETLTEFLSAFPDDAIALNERGILLAKIGRSEESLVDLEHAVKLSPENLSFWQNLTHQQKVIGLDDAAAASALQALKLSLGDIEARQAFVDSVSGLSLTNPNPDLVNEISDCLQHPSLETHHLVRPALQLLLMMDGVSSALEISTPGLIDLNSPNVKSLNSNSLFINVLARGLICEARFECYLVNLRITFLELSVRGGVETQFHDLLCVLAQQCNASDFALYESEKESQAVRALSEKIEGVLAQGSPAPEEVALLACYRPLGKLPFAIKLSSALGPTGSPTFDLLIERQLLHPLEELNILNTVDVITPISGEISDRVREQYDQSPYPKWFSPPNVKPSTPTKLIGSLFPSANLPATLPHEEAILVAGCGSGWNALLTSLLYPNSHVMAVDLSAVNLAHATRSARHFRVKNLSFAQADIMHLGQLNQSFGFVESVGVLHHTEDTERAWKILASKTATGGVMHIGLYSQAARANLDLVSDFIKNGGYGTAVEDIRLFRRDVLSLPTTDLVYQTLKDNREFYSISSCRDLLFHENENRHSLGQISQMMEHIGLKFIGFQLHSGSIVQAYLRTYPDDQNMTNLENWAAFERANPETFAGMYDFYCLKLPQ